MSSKIVLSVADLRSEVSAVDLRAGVSVPDVKSVIAATLLSAEFVLDASSNHQWLEDQFAFSDVVAFGVSKNPSDSVTLDDAITQIAFGLGKSDTVTMSESISVLLEVLRAFSDSVSFTDAPVNAVSIAPTDQYQLTEADAKSVSLGKSDSYALNDADVFDLGKGVADQISLSESLSRTVSFNRAFTDAFSLDDAATVNALIKDSANTKTNVFGFADDQALGFDKTASDSFSFSDAIDSFVVGKGITDTVSMTENFSFALFSNAAMNAATLNSAPFNQ